MAEQITFYMVGSSDTVDVPCVPTMLNDSDRLIVGGFESAASIALNVRTGHFISADMDTITVDSDLFTADNSTARPQDQKKCVFRGKTFRIIIAGEDSTRAYIHLVLADANTQ